MAVQADRGADDPAPPPPQTHTVSRERRLPARAHDAMAGDGLVHALAHHVSYRAGSERTAGEHPDETVGRDPARRNALDDVVDGLRPIGGGHVPIMPEGCEPNCGDAPTPRSRSVHRLATAPFHP